jgi:hypothetical protein
MEPMGSERRFAAAAGIARPTLLKFGYVLLHTRTKLGLHRKVAVKRAKWTSMDV